MSVLSKRNVTRKDPREVKPAVSQVDAIPPELLVRRDNTVRYEKDGPIYATDGKVGTLRKVVVDESTAEVSEIIIAVDGADRFLVLPADIVDRSAGAALFISLNSVQFAERVSNGPPYSKGHFAKADLKALMHRRGGSRPMIARRTVTNVGIDFVETPLGSPLDRLRQASSTSSVAAD